VNCWRVPRSKAALAGVIAIETRDRDGPPTPGPRLPAPQPLNKLRHTKTIGARCGFTGAVRLVAWAICRRRASSSDRLLMQMLYCRLVRQHGDQWPNTTAKVFALQVPRGEVRSRARQMVQKTRSRGATQAHHAAACPVWDPGAFQRKFSSNMMLLSS